MKPWSAKTTTEQEIQFLLYKTYVKTVLNKSFKVSNYFQLILKLSLIKLILKGYRHEHIVFVDSGYFDIPNGLARSPLRFPDPISPV